MKPVVYYIDVDWFLIEGQSAFVTPINHKSPLVSNTTMAKTSPIVRIGDDGEFETENTIYRPLK